MGAAENKQLIQNMFAELSKGNGEAFLAAMADDVDYKLEGTTKFSSTFKGTQDVVNRLLQPLTAALESGIAVTPYNFIAEGDFVVMQANGKATTKTGKPYNNSYCHVFRIANGKIQQITEYLDTELVTEAFGK